MRRGWLIATTFAAALLVAQRPASAGDPGVAREQLKIGYTLVQEGKFSEALPHLVESLRLDPKAITLINLADCEEKLGRLADAMAHWGDARSRAQAEGARPIEEEAEKRATALDPRVPRLTIALAASAPKDATVERDGVALGPPSIGIPLPVDPGLHKIVVKAKGRADGSASITLAEGDKKRIEVDVGGGGGGGGGEVSTSPSEGTQQPGDKKTGSTSSLVYIGFGVAAAGVAAGSITGIMALGKASDVDKACPQLKCSDSAALDDRDSGRTLGWISTISFGVAGVGAVVGLYGLLFANKGGADTPKVDSSVGSRTTTLSITPMMMMGAGGGASLKGRF